MADEQKNPFDEYKGVLDKEFKHTKGYLQKLEDGRNKVLISAREKYDYDVVNNREKFAEDITKEFESHVRDMYKINKDDDYDKRSFKSLMRKRLGVTEKEIKRIVMSGETDDDIYKKLDQEISQADSQFRQEHFYDISHDYVDVDKPETLDHIIKYLKLDKMDNFDVDSAKKRPEDIKRLFIRKGIDGSVHPQFIPTEMLKEHKPEKKDKNAA